MEGIGRWCRSKTEKRRDREGGRGEEVNGAHVHMQKKLGRRKREEKEESRKRG